MSRSTGQFAPDDEEAQQASVTVTAHYGTLTTPGYLPNSDSTQTSRARSEIEPLLSSAKNVSGDPVSRDWYPTSLSDGTSSKTLDGDTLGNNDDTELLFGFDSDRSWPRRWKEARVVMSYAFPILITQLLEYSLLISSVIALGHLSTIALAASTLGSMTASVSGFTLIAGMASALDSLLPQAWGTAGGQKHLVGLWTLRMTAVVAVTLTPIYMIWHNSEGILLSLRQDVEVARLASLYLRWMSLSLPAYAFNFIVRKYYQSIGLLHIPTLIIIVGAPLNAALNYILVWGPGPFSSIRLGFIGAPIATSITLNLMSLFYAYHLLSRSPPEPWFKLNGSEQVKEVFKWDALAALIRLGVAGVGQTASQGRKLMHFILRPRDAVAASLLGPVTLASQSVVLVSSSTSYQLSLAISSGAAVRIGNLLGSGHAVQAEVASHVSFVLIGLVSCFGSAIFLLFCHKWAYMFNDDPEVVALVARVLPLVALFQILDGMDNMIGTILRVTGRQFTGALLNLTGYYVLGIPLGLILTFYSTQWSLGLLGLWIGLSFSLLFIALLGTWYCLQTDWSAEVERVRLRLKTGEDEGLGRLNLDGDDRNERIVYEN
ncbi:hypothetical protein FRB93_008158 [Tulasnella sp. JGI-2019a]|nr:hypothetical protein FRB93_008158 [Tulasnella sp. JGI-2019a]